MIPTNLQGCMASLQCYRIPLLMGPDFTCTTWNAKDVSEISEARDPHSRENMSCNKNVDIEEVLLHGPLELVNSH